MASLSANSSKHATLAAGVVDTVTLTFDYPLVEVLSRNGAAEVYFTVDGPDPAVGGDNTYVLPAAVGSQTVFSPASGHSTVRLVSSGAVAYSVIGVGR